MNNPMDIKDFRRALGQFPTGVTVITTIDGDGTPIGVTASSFNTVSIDPPLILWSVDKGAYSAKIFDNAKHFAVNVLGKDQVDTSNKFAGRGEDKFAGVSYTVGDGGSPLFESCAAQFECKTWNVVDGGDHLIIIGEVVNYRYDEATLPLVFSCGSYAVSTQHPSSMKHEQAKIGNNGFLRDYLPYLLHAAYGSSSSALYPRFMAEHNVTPEEWRILTLLADSGASVAAELAQMVMQPENTFRATVELMKDKGQINAQEELIALTVAGTELVNKLFAIAKEHEVTVLNALSEESVTQLKESLKVIGALS